MSIALERDEERGGGCAYQVRCKIVAGTLIAAGSGDDQSFTKLLERVDGLGNGEVP